MNRNVAPDQTLTTHGTLAAGSYLLGEAGTAAEPFGAVIIATGHASNFGIINLYGSAILDSSFGGSGATLLAEGVLTNAGIVTVGGANDFIDASALLSITNDVTNTGEILLQNGALGFHYYAGGPGGQLTDSGTLTNTGTVLLEGGIGYNANGSTASISGLLNNAGTVTVQQAAELSIATSGVLTNSADLTIDGGTLEFYGGPPYGSSTGTLDVNGTLANSGLLTLGGGVVDYGNGYSISGLGADAAVAGVLINTGAIDLQGGAGYRYGYFPPPFSTGPTLSLTGALTNQGSIELHAGYAPPGGYYGAGATLIDSGTLTNTGTIVVDGATTASADALLTVTATGTLTNSGAITGTGSIDNEGLLRTTGGDIAIAALRNTGTIALAANTQLTIGSAITQSGQLDLAAHATLTLAGSVSATQQIAFGGPDATLILASPNSFAGVLTNFAPTDTIDFAGDFAGAALTAATAAGSLLDLTFANGATFDLRLDAPLAGATLTLSSDHHGGTDLRLGAAAPLPLIAPLQTDHPLA
jgi:fibronectin-binding autotransporter adhesin